MDQDELKARTKQVALRILKWVDALPRTRSGNANELTAIIAASRISAAKRR